MKKQTILLTFFLFSFILLTACTQQECESGLYTEDGKCCTYVCDVECPDGYEEGTCHCECRSGEIEEDVNLDDVFEDGGDIEPPVLPP